MTKKDVLMVWLYIVAAVLFSISFWTKDHGYIGMVIIEIILFGVDLIAIALLGGRD